METYIAIDLETTGLSPKLDRIVEIGAVRVEDGQITDELKLFVDPGRELPARITELTGITQDMLKDAVSQETAIRQVTDFCEDLVLLGHNILFDYSFLKRSAVNHGLPFVHQGIDTLKLARAFSAGCREPAGWKTCVPITILRRRIITGRWTMPSRPNACMTACGDNFWKGMRPILPREN